jgi:RsmE family RNA methyltransferase
MADAVLDANTERVMLAVGPEGGWNDFEIALLERRGFQPIGLGARTLRVDTACIALLGILHDALGNRGLA